MIPLAFYDFSDYLELLHYQDSRFQEIVDLAKAVINCDHVSLSIIHQDRVYIKSQTKNINGQIDRDNFPIEWITSDPSDFKLINSEDLAPFNDKSKSSTSLSAYACQKIFIDDKKLLGAIEIFDTGELEIPDKEKGILKNLADQVATVFEFKRTQIELKKANEDLRISLETSKLGLWEMNPKTNELKWNDIQLEIYGLTREMFEKDYFHFIGMVHPEDVDHVNAAMSKVWEGEEVFDVEWRINLENGGLKYINGSARPLLNDKGEIYKAIGINRDVTEQKLYQKNLESINSELKRASEEVDYFVYSTSHNLRAPISTSMGVLNLLRMGVENPEEYFDMILYNLKRLDEAISEITDYYKNSRNELAFGEVDLCELCNQIKEELRFDKSGSEYNLNFNYTGGEVFRTDKTRLRIILLNLISNALKYTDHSANGYCNVNFEINKNKMRIQIEDNGIGIPASEKDNVFKMFYRATNFSQGTGLGLYVVRQSLEKIGGSISLNDKSGGGTVADVQIIFPQK